MDQAIQLIWKLMNNYESTQNQYLAAAENEKEREARKWILAGRLSMCSEILMGLYDLKEDQNID